MDRAYHTPTSSSIHGVDSPVAFGSPSSSRIHAVRQSNLASTFKSPVSLVRCTEKGCTEPEEIPGGRIIAPLLGTREAMLLWPSPPAKVLLVKKWRDNDARDCAVEVGDWLTDEFGVQLYVYEDDDEDEATRFPQRFTRYNPPSCNNTIVFHGGGGSNKASAASQVQVGSPSRISIAGNQSSSINSGAGHMACPPVGLAAGDDIDLIVSVGGDGTVLHISGLFQAAMPPVVAIAFGSLGFMTVHSLNSCTDILTRILVGRQVAVPPASAGAFSSPLRVAAAAANEGAEGIDPMVGLAASSPEAEVGLVSPPRSIATGQGAGLGDDSPTVWSSVDPPPSSTTSSSLSQPQPSVTSSSNDSATAPAAAAAGSVISGSAGAATLVVREPIPVSLRMRLRVDVHRRGCAPSSPPEVSHVVLNELLLERGSSPYMATLNAYIDDEPLTTVAADGLIVATQTGSTAYSLSAGGSILSPNTAAIVFTPICPHTLSFRPLLFPDSAVIRLEVPVDARSSAWCSFDGRHSMELRAGDFVVVRSSPFPLPLVCRRSATGDWVRAIKCKLYWNVRERQKAFKRPPPTHQQQQPQQQLQSNTPLVGGSNTAASGSSANASAASAAAAPTASANASADRLADSRTTLSPKLLESVASQKAVENVANDSAAKTTASELAAADSSGAGASLPSPVGLGAVGGGGSNSAYMRQSSFGSPNLDGSSEESGFDLDGIGLIPPVSLGLPAELTQLSLGTASAGTSVLSSHQPQRLLPPRHADPPHHYSPPGSPTLPASRRASDAFEGDFLNRSTDNAAAAAAASFEGSGSNSAAAGPLQLAPAAVRSGAGMISQLSTASTTAGSSPMLGAMPGAAFSSPQLHPAAALILPSMSQHLHVDGAPAMRASPNGAGGVPPGTPTGIRPVRSYRFINPQSSSNLSGMSSAAAAAVLSQGASTVASSSSGVPGSLSVGSVTSSKEHDTSRIPPATLLHPATSPASNAGVSSAAQSSSGRSHVVLSTGVARSSEGGPSEAAAPGDAPIPSTAHVYHFLGSSSALDYPDHIEFDSDSGTARGVMNSRSGIGGRAS